LLSAAALAYNRFQLEDDAISIFWARTPISQFISVFFGSGAAGRFMPFYWISHWLTFRLLPEAPWSLTLFNVGYLLAAVALVYSLARALAGNLAGVLAAWFFTFNLATMETLFTLSKNENGQLPFWLLSLLLLTRAVGGGETPTRRWALPLFAFAVLSACFFKETGVLLAAPLAVGFVVALKGRGLSARDRRRMAGFVSAGLAVVCADLMVIYLYNRHGDTYFTSNVIHASGGLLSRFHYLDMFNRDRMLATLLIGGLAAGAALTVREIGARRLAAALLTAQLAVFIGFFGLLAHAQVYNLYAGAAFAAVLLGAVLARLGQVGGVGRGVALAAFLLLGVWGGQRTATGVGALLGFGWIEDRLTAAVVEHRPARLLFYRSGSRSTHFHAKYTWNDLHQVDVQIALLDFPTDADPELPHLTMRDLQPGDWIVEQFAPHLNAANPLRGIGFVRLEKHGLVDSTGQTLVPVEIIDDFRVSYPAFVNNPVLGLSPSSYIRSRIYRVTGTPHVAFEGLDADLSMGQEATLWVNTMRGEPITLRAEVVAPGERRREVGLSVLAGERPVADCPPDVDGRVICTFSPAGKEAPVEAGWWRFVLRARHAYAQQESGVNTDLRRRSLKFSPTLETGVAQAVSR